MKLDLIPYGGLNIIEFILFLIILIVLIKRKIKSIELKTGLLNILIFCLISSLVFQIMILLIDYSNLIIAKLVYQELIVFLTFIVPGFIIFIIMKAKKGHYIAIAILGFLTFGFFLYSMVLSQELKKQRIILETDGIGNQEIFKKITNENDSLKIEIDRLKN